MSNSTQFLSVGLSIATALAMVVAATSGDILVSSEIVRGGSALSVLRCTYVKGLRSETLQFVITPENASRCAFVRRPVVDHGAPAGPLRG